LAGRRLGCKGGLQIQLGVCLMLELLYWVERLKYLTSLYLTIR